MVLRLRSRPILINLPCVPFSTYLNGERFCPEFNRANLLSLFGFYFVFFFRIITRLILIQRLLRCPHWASLSMCYWFLLSRIVKCLRNSSATGYALTFTVRKIRFWFPASLDDAVPQSCTLCLLAWLNCVKLSDMTKLPFWEWEQTLLKITRALD